MDEALKEIQFCEPILIGEATATEEQHQLILELADAEAATARALRAEVGAGPREPRAWRDATEIAQRLQSLPVGDEEAHFTAMLEDKLPDDLGSWWPAHCAVLAYRLDVAEMELITYFARQGGDVLTYRHDVNYAALRSLLAICKHGIAEELAFMADRLTAVLLPEPLRAALRAGEGGTLVISADALLEDVPWEALGDGRMYLGTSFDLVVTPSLLRSARMLRDKPRRAVRPARFTFVANPTGDLVFSEDEAAGISTLLANRGLSAVSHVRTGRNEFRIVIESAQWIHYAGHANYLDADPSSSFLYLRDGPLTVREIAAGHNTPDSVWILNACEAAQAGSVNASRSRVGFPQALLLKGAASVVAANWPTVDRTSGRHAAPLLRGSPHQSLDAGPGDAAGSQAPDGRRTFAVPSGRSTACSATPLWKSPSRLGRAVPRCHGAILAQIWPPRISRRARIRARSNATSPTIH